MVDIHLVNASLRGFGLPLCTEFEVLQRFESGAKLRLLVKAVTPTSSFVLKYFADEDVTERALEAQGLLARCFLDEGIPVPARYKTMGGGAGTYHNRAWVGNRDVTVTAEDFMEGEPVQAVSLSLMKQLGGILGRMHRAAESSGLAMGNGSAWSLFVGTQSGLLGQFDENLSNVRGFLDKIRDLPVDRPLLDLVHKEYIRKRACLQRVWGELPRGAVQGDFSLNNLLVDPRGRVTGIVDFHLAGDEVFVNHVMSEGVFLSYAAPQVSGETGVMRDEYLLAFLAEYQAYRPLGEKEIETSNYLYNIFRPFRFERLDEIVRLASDGEFGKVDDQLRFIMHHLNRRFPGFGY